MKSNNSFVSDRYRSFKSGTVYQQLLQLSFSILIALCTGVQLQAQESQLWTTTSSGGEYNNGAVIKTDPDGNNLQVVHSFQTIEGRRPYASSFVASGKGTYYAMSRYGGANDEGVLFEYNPSTNKYEVLVNFDSASTGKNPLASVLVSNGFIYGLTSRGGHHNVGTMFKYEIASGVITKPSRL